MEIHLQEEKKSLKSNITKTSNDRTNKGVLNKIELERQKKKCSAFNTQHTDMGASLKTDQD